MKRILTTLFCLILLLSCPVPASAAGNGPFQTAGDLLEYWNQIGFLPNYVTGIWSTDGSSENLTFGLVPGEEGEAGKQEILALIIDDGTVAFVTQTYSRNYLSAIMEDVNTYFERDLGFTQAGTNEYENRVDIEIHVDYQENTDTLAAVEELGKKYGSAVFITFTDTVIVLALEATATDPAEGPMLVMANPRYQPMPLDLLLWAGLVLISFLLVIERQRRRLAAVGNGGNVTVAEQLTCADVERRVRDADPDVPPALDARIHATIDSISGEKA